MKNEVYQAEQTAIIVGAGIVGATLAHLIAANNTYGQVVLVDTDISTLPGSTGHAPGFVGQLNEIPALTELAKRSVNHYVELENSFDRVGGLEVALSSEGNKNLEKRKKLAEKYGLKAQLLTPSEAVQKAPHLIKEDEVVSALHFPLDGTANAQVITAIEKEEAQKNGAILLKANVKKILLDESNKTVGLATDKGDLHSNTVIISTGIWSNQLLPQFPVIPVAHPYVYSFPKRDSKRAEKMPFVRWPERHVYARDHGLQDGMGSYAHAPVVVNSTNLGSTAYGDWKPDFESILRTSASVIPDETLKDFTFTPKQAFNGIFSVTPDGMPLVGSTGYKGLYCAVAVWVTHAYGSAKLLADILSKKLDEKDQWLVESLNPQRFEGQDKDTLKSKAASTYNDVYNTTSRK